MSALSRFLVIQKFQDDVCVTQLQMSHDAPGLVRTRVWQPINIIRDCMAPLIAIALTRLYSVDQSTRNQGASALSGAMALNVAHRRGFRWPILPANTRVLLGSKCVFLSGNELASSSLKMVLVIIRLTATGRGKDGDRWWWIRERNGKGRGI